ncbi:hypothetical protein LENED_002946 [Lentinula edodes]|uniref:Uncharacterized protein n=1 Tax=Lentinula edodes TaxID=5353 RepID=A0A1Q3E2H2_LENED|nr:hypothetical protein LENED_002946 [Lentinula edodes]
MKYCGNFCEQRSKPSTNVSNLISSQVTIYVYDSPVHLKPQNRSWRKGKGQSQDNLYQFSVICSSRATP